MEAGGKDVDRTAAEEALKRSTDCVYFLASPLTCKKGVECEYRHSEGARVNPRDCWFWLNGNCLNPKCSFRHPPLDGLIGTPTATGPALPVQPKISTHPSSTHSSAAHNRSKQGAPCYYFQRGGCLKGDRCAYLHGTAPIPNSVSQQVPKVSAPVFEPVQTIKKTSWRRDKSSLQNVPKENSHRPIEIVTPVKPTARADTPVANVMPMKEILQSHLEFPSIPETCTLGDVNAQSMSQSHQSEPLDDDFQNEVEGNGYFRESSHGFDVLVDDESEDPGYFCERDELEGAPHHDGRISNPVADFEYHPSSSDYETAAKFRVEFFGDAGEYAHHGAFPERALELPSVSDMGRLRREDNVSLMDGSDLRHRILKKRRVNASRSGVSPDGQEVRTNDDHYFEEHLYHAHGRRNDPRNAPRDVPIGKRLRGRLSLPRRIPVGYSGDRYSEREVLRRNSGRSSPIRPTNYHARGLHDRINRRSSERFRSDEKNMVAPSTRSAEPVILDFAGPKRLSELKSRKVPDISDHRSIGGNDNSLSRELGSMRIGKAALGHQEAVSVSFKGPQPLSVILKRKRETSAANSAPYGNEELNGKGGEDLAYATSAMVTSSSQILQPSESARKNDHAVDHEAAVVDIEEDPTVGDLDQATDTEEDAVEYNDEDGEYADYEQGDEEYYEENEGAEYEAVILPIDRKVLGSRGNMQTLITPCEIHIRKVLGVCTCNTPSQGSSG